MKSILFSTWQLVHALVTLPKWCFLVCQNIVIINFSSDICAGNNGVGNGWVGEEFGRVVIKCVITLLSNRLDQDPSRHNGLLLGGQSGQ